MTTSVHLDQFVTENGHFFDPFSKSFPLSAYDLVVFIQRNMQTVYKH